MGILRLDKVIVEIVLDEAPENPRTWDNLGTMVCWHRRYTLGDPRDYPDPQAFLQAIRVRDTVLLPLYLYDHSGLTMRTDCAQFRICDTASWDWGQVGYIYAPHARIHQKFGITRLSRHRRAQVVAQLCQEVETYTQYLRGDIYGYTITDRQTSEVLDACWGFYGENPHRNGMAESFPHEYREAILAYFYAGAA